MTYAAGAAAATGSRTARGNSAARFRSASCPGGKPARARSSPRSAASATAAAAVASAMPSPTPSAPWMAPASAPAPTAPPAASTSPTQPRRRVPGGAPEPERIGAPGDDEPDSGCDECSRHRCGTEHTPSQRHDRREAGHQADSTEGRGDSGGETRPRAPAYQLLDHRDEECHGNNAGEAPYAGRPGRGECICCGGSSHRDDRGAEQTLGVKSRQPGEDEQHLERERHRSQRYSTTEGAEEQRTDDRRTQRSRVHQHPGNRRSGPASGGGAGAAVAGAPVSSAILG